MDALSDVLRAVRLTGAVFFDVRASEPWVAEAPAGDAVVGTIFPGSEHLISYHVVTEGTIWGGVPRIWGKLKSALEANFHDEQRAAMEVGLRRARAKQEGEVPADQAVH